jgi:hypothetical protein
MKRSENKKGCIIHYAFAAALCCENVVSPLCCLGHLAKRRNAGLSKQRPTTIQVENRTERLFKLQKV